MANSMQKKIKFSKGQINPELLERTDLEVYDSSASKLKNVVVSCYGGIKTRQGTKFIDEISFYSESDKITPTITSGIGGDVSYLTDTTNVFESDGIGDVKDILIFNLGSIVENAVFKITGLKFNYIAPSLKGLYRAEGNLAGTHTLTTDDLTIVSAGKGVNGSLTAEYNGDETDIEENFTYTKDTAGSILTASATCSFKIPNNQEDTTLNIYEKDHKSWIVPCDVYVSSDGIVYSKIDSIVITEKTQKFNFNIEKAQYIKFVMDTENPIGTTLSIDLVKIYKSSKIQEKVKFIDFIYNNNQKYLLVLLNERIDIYRDDNQIASVQATGLKDDYFDILDYAYQEDTVIFVHPDIMPYRLVRNSDTDWAWSNIEIKNIPYEVFGKEVETEKTVPITPSKTDGSIKITSGSNAFDASMVGQYIDGGGGRMKITEFTDAKTIKGYTIIPFYTTDAITKWTYISGYEPVFSETRGYPRSVCFGNQRLFFGGSKGKPTSIWASRLGDYYNFKNSGNYDNDSISFEMNTNSPIINIIFNRGLHVFTSDFEATSPENNFTPNTFSVIPGTNNGIVVGIKPVVLNGAVCFIEKNGKSLLSYMYDYQQSGYTTNNVSKFTDTIEKPVGLGVEINSAKELGDRMFIILSSGEMLIINISLPDNVFAPTVFQTEGKVLQVCSLKEDIYLCVERNGIKFIEKLEDLKTDNTKNITISGDSFIDKDFSSSEVYLYGDDFKYLIPVDDEGNGEIPEELLGEYYIGYPFEYEVVGNPIAINNRTMSIKKRIAKATVVCKDTDELTFCDQTQKNQDVYTFYACTIYENNITYKITGKFYPIEVLSVELNINYEG